MNPEIKEQWIAALESGDYPQGRLELENKRGQFCCLGVLCDLAVKAGVIERFLKFTGTEERVAYGLGDEVSYTSLPPAVRNWAGIETTFLPDQIGSCWSRSLEGLNDEGKTFYEIALVIKEHF